jgi:tetratricopeptide (TPR) repeat protein
MRGTQPARLFEAASLAVIAAALSLAGAAQAQSRDARMCATQTESLADKRIAACSGMLGSRHLHGKQDGVAYELRGLAYLDRGDIAHALADLNQAITLAPDFAPAYQNRGNAWYARGNYGQAIADYDTAIKLDPNSPSPYVNRATVRRDLGYADGALADYQKAISLGAGGARLYGGRSPTSTAPCRSSRARRTTCCAGTRGRTVAISTARSPITAKRRGSRRRISRPIPRRPPSGQ